MLPHKDASVSPSPVLLALLIGLAALGIGLALFVLISPGGSTSASQPAAALAPATATAASTPTLCVPEDDDDETCYELTPTRVVAADTPSGPTATQLPLPPPQTPGPTAQFTQLLPLEQWRTYQRMGGLQSQVSARLVCHCHNT